MSQMMNGLCQLLFVYLNDKSKNLDLPSPVASALNTTLKGALSQAHSATLFKDELHRTQATQNAREQRRQRSRRVIKKGGPLYAEEARRMVQQREKDEIYDMQRLLVRNESLRESIQQLGIGSKKFLGLRSVALERLVWSGIWKIQIVSVYLIRNTSWRAIMWSPSLAHRATMYLIRGLSPTSTLFFP